jgi:hypothetical protein
MKVEASKTKKLIAIALGIVAIIMVARALFPGGGGASPGHAPVATAPRGSAAIAADSLDPRLHVDLLANAESVVYEGQGRNIFRSASQIEIPSVKVSPLIKRGPGSTSDTATVTLPPTPPAPPLPPPPPPINLKFFGYSTGDGRTPQAFLSQGDEVWIAHEGDVVNRQYKIVHITPGAVEVEDLLNNNRQSIRLSQG